MKLHTLAAIVLTAGTLAGCEDGSPRMTRTQVEATGTAKCKGYGFKPQTDAFANCKMQYERDYAAEVHRYDDAVSSYAAQVSDQMHDDMRVNKVSPRY